MRTSRTMMGIAGLFLAAGVVSVLAEKADAQCYTFCRPVRVARPVYVAPPVYVSRPVCVPRPVYVASPVVYSAPVVRSYRYRSCGPVYHRPYRHYSRGFSFGFSYRH